MSLLRTILYFFREAFVALWRHKALHGFALFVVSLSLFVLGFSRYLTGNVNALLKGWEDTMEVRVFLKGDLPQSDVQALAAKFREEPVVASVDIVTPEEGLKVLARIAPAFGNLGPELGDNPLPTALAVRLKAPLDLGRVRLLVDRAVKWPGVDQVLFDWDWVQHLRTYSRFVALIGWILFGALGVAAVFTVAAITRIIALSRREEIAILHFVGATGGSIRGPFVAGGLLLGLLGGLLALVLLLACHAALRAAAGGEALFLQWLSAGFLTLRDQALLLSMGGALGAFGGAVSLGSLEHWSWSSVS